MKRVVVTGIGLLTPIGSGREQFWSELIAGRCGIAPVTSFDTRAFPVHKGAEVKDFKPDPYFRRRSPEEMGRGSQLAVAAARMAIEDGGVDLSPYDKIRVGVSMGTTSGEPQIVERYNDIRKAEGLSSIPKELSPK